MKNYKGFNKLPYCNAHYPQLSATVVSDTPELRRIAQTTNMQSQAVYHADFVNNIRGTVTSMAEDNEMRRAKDIGNVISPAAYRQRPEGGSSTGGEDYRSGGSTSEMSYTRPMRSYNEEDDRTPQSYTQPPVQSYTQPPAQAAQPNAGRMLPVPPTPQQPQSQGPVYTAMYDYDAQDDDEVCFQENDRILNCEVIDEGWVKGTVQRTGQRGMIPANYIEIV